MDHLLHTYTSYSADSLKSDQEFLLSVYKLAVAYYQPKIEDRTDVRFGPISVWNYDFLWRHQFENYKRSMGFVRSFLAGRQLQQFRDAAQGVIEEGAKEIGAAYYRNAIYVSFASACSHEDWIAEIVVHELAHALWENLGGPFSSDSTSLRKTERRQLSLLEEGFATFAQRVWFRDLYPLHARIDVGDMMWEPSSVYEQGFQMIRRIVKKHGSQILFEVPPRWREFCDWTSGS